MNNVTGAYAWQELDPNGRCSPSESIRSALDRQIDALPSSDVSDNETRYPTDEPSMRAFLETFFTRHLFQLQKSLFEYIPSPAFKEAARFAPLRVLDIGSGPAVASLAIMDMIQRTMCSANPNTWISSGPVRIVHVLNDTSTICLETGKRMLGVCRSLANASSLGNRGDRIFTLWTAFPDNMAEINRVASVLGGYDLILLSYAMTPLVDEYGLQIIATAVRRLERLCMPHGRILIVQDRFREPLVRRLAHVLNVEYREQMVTQEIYPPKEGNETHTYTYFDCFYSPRWESVAQRFIMT